jgi:hypothetical protein
MENKKLTASSEGVIKAITAKGEGYVFTLKDRKNVYANLETTQKALRALGLPTSPMDLVKLNESLSRNEQKVSFNLQKVAANMSKAVDVFAFSNPRVKADQNNKDANIWNADAETPLIRPVPVPHLKADDIRIGYSVFNVPVRHVNHQIGSFIHQQPVLNEAGTIKVGTGYSSHTYSVGYTCTNNYEVTKGVRDVIDQIILDPFISCSGGPFGMKEGEGDIPHHHFGVENISISTIPGMPSAINVEMNLVPFLFSYWCPQAENKYSDNGYQLELDDVACWPLKKLWSRTRKRSIFDNTAQLGLNGNFTVSFLSQEVMNDIVDTAATIDNSKSEDFYALKSLSQALGGVGFQGDAAVLTSPNVKQISTSAFSNNEIVYLVKVHSRQIFEKLVSQPAFAGLADWSKWASHNFIDDKGNYLPQSNQIDATQIGRNITAQRGFGFLSLNQSGSDLSFVEIPPSKNRSQVDRSISTYLREQADQRKESNNPIDTAYESQVLANPQEHFAVCLRLNVDTEKKLLPVVKSMLSLETEKLSSVSSSQRKTVTSALRDRPGSYSPVFTSGNREDEDIIITQIGGVRSSNIVPLQINGVTMPVHQYLGGTNAEFSVKGECYTLEAKRKIEFLKNEFDQRCLHVLSGEYGGDVKQNAPIIPFVLVQNEIFSLLGVDFAMPVSISFDTVNGKPGAWSFDISFLEYNPKAQAAERIKFLQTTLQDQQRVLDFQNPDPAASADPIVESAVEYFSLQYALSKLETRPDMELPTLGERDFWISTLREEAKYRLSNGVARKNLSQVEVDVIDTCEEFLRNTYCLKQIAKFEDPYKKDEAQAPITNSSFVDPDFFVCYDEDMTFNSTLTRLCEKEFGSPKPGYRADTSKVDQSTVWREYDPTFRTNTMYGPAYRGSDGEETEDHVKQALKNTYPEDKRAAAEAALKEAGAKLEEHPSAWWKGTSANLEGEAFEDNNPEYLRGSQNKAIMPILDTDASGQAAVEYANKFGKDTYDLLSFSWRRRMVAEALKTQNFSGPLTEDNIKSDGYLLPFVEIDFDSTLAKVAGFMANLGDSFTKLVVGDLGVGVPTFDKLKLLPEDVRGYIQYASEDFENRPLSDLVNQAFKQSRKPELEEFIESSKLSFIQRTAIQKKNFDKVGTTYSTQKAAESTPLKHLIAFGEMYDSIGKKWGVDPHILRAYFLRNGGYGTLQVGNTATGNTGWGLLSKEVVKGNESPVQVVDLFAQTFSKYLKKYQNIPSLALIATFAELDSSGRKEFWGGTAGNTLSTKLDTFLSTTADKVGRSKGSEAGAKILQQAISSLPKFPDRINVIWAAYVEISRTLGSHVSKITDDKSDIFFDPLNPFILMDTRSNQTFVDTKLTPGGTHTRIDLSRQTIEASPAEMRSRRIPLGNDTANVDDLARLASRSNFGLTPSNEAAIYGSMVDCQAYARFGRLVQAYPVVQVMIINEGFYFAGGSTKIWDQFYTRGGITNVAVKKNRLNPADEAEVTFSNLFYSLTKYTQLDALRQELTVRQSQRFQHDSIYFLNNFSTFFERLYSNLITKNPDKEFLTLWQYNHLQQLALTPGARLQIRMGYGSNLSTIPVVFNGLVTSVPINQGTVTITAVGDGGELLRPITDNLQQVDNGYLYQSATGIFGAGTEPAHIVGQSMVPNNLYTAALTAGRYGINRLVPHFGNIYFDGNGYHTSELFINLYGASKKHIEQSFDYIGQTFNKNALYNWDDTSLISISVKEPSVWKTAQVCAHAVTDFVVGVVPFHTRSTLFFGKWWYPLNYAYDPSILNFNRRNVSETPEVNTPYPTKVEESIGKVAENYYLIEYPTDVPVSAVQSNPKLIKLKKISKQDIGVILKFPFEKYEEELRAKLTNQLKAEDSSKLHPIVKEWLKTAGTPIKNISYVIKNVAPNTNQTGTDIIVVPFNEENSGIILDTATIDSSVLREVQELVTYLKWKPYMQVWPVCSGLNLIDTNIQPDSSQVFTDAQAQNTFNGFLSKDSISKTLTFSVDDDISPSERRTFLVDTGLYVTGLQKGFSRSVGDAVASWVPVVGENVVQTPDTQAVENSVVNYLADSVKMMYTGTVTLSGQSAIKPGDLILLNDVHNSLDGPLFVREVFHTFSAQTGFVTMVTPDCVAMSHFSLLGPKYLTALSTGPLSTIGQYLLGRAMTSLLGAYMGKKLKSLFHMRKEEIAAAKNAIASETTSIVRATVPETVDPVTGLVKPKSPEVDFTNPKFNQEVQDIINRADLKR